MLQFKRTTSQNSDFMALVALLDADLAQRDGEDHAFYHQFNGIQSLPYTIVAYRDAIPVGCGALKPFDDNAMEVKRMYILPTHRGKGLATQMLGSLENWAAELGYEKCVLETGKRQPEAIALYRKNGYFTIPNYGPYEGIENSVCFEKNIR